MRGSNYTDAASPAQSSNKTVCIWGLSSSIALRIDIDACISVVDFMKEFVGTYNFSSLKLCCEISSSLHQAHRDMTGVERLMSVQGHS